MAGILTDEGWDAALLGAQKSAIRRMTEKPAICIGVDSLVTYAKLLGLNLTPDEAVALAIKNGAVQYGGTLWLNGTK
jgi:hypothetical protein